jgi:hypothetical protein
MFFHEMPGVTWTNAAAAGAKERYNLLQISDYSVNLADLFGEEPEYFPVHHGDVTVDGALLLEDDFSPAASTLYIIEGDLRIRGPLSLQNGDSNTSLYVAGSVFVKDLVCLWHSQLFVERSLAVEEVLVTNLNDAGHLVVHGPVSAGTWIEAGGRGEISGIVSPATRLIARSHPLHFSKGAAFEDIKDAVRAEFFDGNGYLDTAGIARAILNGRPVLR